MTAPKAILQLVDKFHCHRDDYKSMSYNEARVRIEFIDPMFAALGWDMANKGGFAEQYKDVVHEAAIKIGGSTKAPDYSFRIGGTRKFYLEAKKPAVNLKDNPDPAYQLRRYAWTAKMPLSILTDFEEFIIYDTRVKPVKGDKASTARTLYIPYTKYAEEWDKIDSIFSKEAILKGAFDKYAESNKKKKGTAEVDDAFLAEIEDWRMLLARNIALRNAELTERDLNSAVQRTIDRIIFLRICEDRGIENYGRLQALRSGDQVYPRMCHLFREADARYNSGLFHFQKEKGRQEADTWTLNLAIDDKCLKDILKRLYYPDSPYEFSVLPADILGNVYERFLGSVITLTKGHRAKVEQKPEVRKAGGVYYTPTYIVDYIVKHTVGKLLENKTPQQAAGQTATGKRKKNERPIAILDPACGSGSFLLGAYQFLLDWYLDQYAQDPKKYTKGKQPKIYQTASASAAPSLRGGPAPPSLRGGSADAAISFDNHPGPAPPSLRGGSAPPSLRGGPADAAISFDTPPDTYRLTTAERKRILLDHLHGVDIDTQAVEVTKLSLLLKVLEEESAETIGKTMALLHQRALPDLTNNIKCGNSLIATDFYERSQLDLLDEEIRYRINPFDWDKEFSEVFTGDYPGFDAVIGNPPYGAAYDASIKKYVQSHFVYSKGKPESYIFFIERAISILRLNGRLGLITPNAWLTNYYGKQIREFILREAKFDSIVDLEPVRVFAKAVVDTVVFLVSKSAEQWADSRVSIEVGRKPHEIERKFISRQQFWTSDEEYVINVHSSVIDYELLQRLSASGKTLGEVVEYSQGVIPYRTREDGAANQYISDVKRGEEWLPLIESASQVKRYSIEKPRSYINYGPWLWCERERKYFEKPKILFHRLRKKLPVQLIACIDETGVINRHSLSNLILMSGEAPEYLYAILGILNSRLANWWFVKKYGLLMEVGGFKISRLPLPRDSQSSINHLRRPVDLMISLHKRLADAKTGHDKITLQRQLNATDTQIDRLVYELYELTDEEIAIVEGSSS